ncbi:MAG: hypothetical protein CGU29_00450 [Candidatus Dactylopiibacterium carminicum]|uniref:DUF2069 domain-containing protein n=1 Tax=Candidatus Dactylopiibacterium carminicum TaxID=857335 RepID=A0A272EZ07_9RHOO|nr:DUF2069 domain-containing protein [Candidatus Dactylopiibacterium carminicum]KAF7600850.1 DUF2069 domain-containing protein [Candidatus Dactylopiibacterium carminicum]PAS95349.1 MAG: hypothetical protein CGU29_00450 [Candidatus Dactylopiibacterium carminicum]PAT00854.1 MAG: hypothetical protein BSR46_00415 [Candidatus Dactylopiibacterium carminicum]
MSPAARSAQKATLVCLLLLIGLVVAMELWLAPLRPGGSWLVLRVLPLLAALRGVLHGRRYTSQWLSLAVWLYFTFGVIRASTDTGLSALAGGVETLVALALFVACAAHARLSAGTPKP